MKNEKAKKVHKTKATLVAELEVVAKVDKGFLNSLERANAETILPKQFPFPLVVKSCFVLQIVR